MSGAKATSAATARRIGTGTAPRGRGRLARKYALLFIGLVGIALLVNSGFDFWFSYQENKDALVRIQQEKAAAAAQRIGEFIGEIQRQIGWTTDVQWASEPLDQRRFDYARLLRQVPAITELSQLDSGGRQLLMVSRLAMDVIGSDADFSKSQAFIQARAHGIWFGPVYFRKESEPYVTLAVKLAGRNAGVTVAEINLKLMWDVVTGLKIGEHGYAYVVDRDGKLIAHPDISLVLRDTDLSKLPQVAAALGAATGAPAAGVARNLAGNAVLSAHAAVSPTGWLVFVEVPLSEAFAPLYGQATRSLILLVAGLAVAALAAAGLARRMTGPIRELQEGAAEIGAGALDRRIAVHTGDELEALAGQFNSMAADLQSSYAELEGRVEARTADLTESLEYQTATSDVLKIISRSTFDLQPVLDTLVETAARLCNADGAGVTMREGDAYRYVATYAVDDEFYAFLRQRPLRPDRGSIAGRTALEGKVVHIPDITADPDYALPEAVSMARLRTLLGAPLLRDGEVVGTLTLTREHVEPFTERQIELVTTFADQAVIAIENTRLITETREALDQQTATAEVLGVINSSPGDLVPVFDAMLEKAMRLCEGAFGSFVSFEDGIFRRRTSRGFPEPLANTDDTVPLTPGGAFGRIVGGEAIVHITDLADTEAYRSANRDRGYARLVDLGGAHTAIFVALRRNETVLGILMIYRQEVRPFSDKQIALLQNFAAQAVIAIENARLINETREALEQQTATAEVLGVINSSPGDLAPVFDAMLEKAMRLCEAETAHLLRFDGIAFSRVASLGISPEFDKLLPLNTPLPHAITHDSVPYRLLSSRSAINVQDLRDDESYRAGAPAETAAVEQHGARTVLFVPLLREGEVIGCLVLHRLIVRAFTDKQVALVENFAAQAVIAMENARLLNETREALEQQTATAEVLQVINSSPGDLAPVFDAMLEKARTLCAVAQGSLVTYDGEYFRLVANHGMPEWFAEQLRRPYPAAPGSSQEQLLRGERFVQIPDVQAAPTSPQNLLSIKAGSRTILFVPLRKDRVLLGFITAVRREVRLFSDKEIALLQNFAAQAVIAIENARLITETREALERQTATAEVLGVINSSPGNLAPVFDAILEKAHALCGAVRGTLFLFDGETFRAAAAHGYPETLAQRLRQGISISRTGVFAPLIAGERLVHNADIRQVDDPLARAVAAEGSVRTNLLLPLRKDGALLGVISCNRSEVRPFSDKEIALLENFAQQAVIAMENARLISETREALEYQTATADVLKVISRSTFDLDPVLTSVVTTAVQLCRATYAVIYRYRDGAFRYAVGYGLVPEYERIERETPIYAGRGTVVGRAAQERRVVQIVDAIADPEYEAVENAIIGNARTMIGVPLMREGEPIGAIALARGEVIPFTGRQIELITTFADQAVIAIENARLLSELRESTDDLARSVDELTVLNEISQAVSSTLDLQSVLSTILTRSVDLSGADAGVIFRYNQAARAYSLVEAQGWNAELVERVKELHIGEAETGMGEAAARRSPVQFADLSTRPSYALRDLTLAAGFRSVMIVPLVGVERTFGAIVLERRATGEFSGETMRLMQTLAGQSVLAIQNARLFREIADKSEELALASQHKSQFLANMSHELRTPLNAILGYTELMADGIYGALPDRANGVLERVQNNGRHLLALINDVLDLSKIEAGQLVLSLEEYTLADVVHTVVSATEALASTKGLALSASVEPGLPTGRGDARRLSQVLLNLVGNAVKFTDTGAVTIAAKRDRGRFIVTVHDTGPGISPDDQDRIFGEFQQVDNSNTRQKGGTGLGLAISKRMVEMQGGTISVESELGRGSTFRVALPIRVEAITEELMGAA